MKWIFLKTIYLNTSHVKVNLKVKLMDYVWNADLNTSHVKVNHKSITIYKRADTI